MGHLTRIANTIVQTVEKGPGQSQIKEFIRGRRCSWPALFLEQPVPNLLGPSEEGQEVTRA